MALEQSLSARMDPAVRPRAACLFTLVMVGAGVLLAWFSSLVAPPWVGVPFAPASGVGPCIGELYLLQKMTMIDPSQLDLSFGSSSANRGEGCLLTRKQRGGARTALFVPSSSQSIPGLGTIGPVGAPRAHAKRSFRRALRRLAVHGHATYRGQTLVCPTREAAGAATVPRHRTSWTPPRSRRPRVGLFSWNTGGLQTSTRHELMRCLTLRNYAVHDHGGLLTLVNPLFCRMQDLSMAELIPGRVVHIRCINPHLTVDIIHVYQYTTTVTLDRPPPYESRAQVWQVIDQCLSNVPFSNLLILARGFNTELYSRTAFHVQDQWELHSCLRNMDCRPFAVTIMCRHIMDRKAALPLITFSRAGSNRIRVPNGGM